MRQQIDVPVPMRDGVQLSADVRMPDTDGPVPAVLIRTPYNNVGFSPEEMSCVQAGYAVVKQDCRGRFDSAGRFEPLREDADGHDTLAWLCAQEWCDGRIGMLGNSYGALTQLTAAWTQPPGLLAISPAVMGHDLFKGLVYHQGVLNLSLAIGWGTGVAGRTVQSDITTDWDAVFEHLPLITMDEAAGCELDYYREWLSHPTYDSYWAATSVEQHFSAIDVPAFHIGGWYDVYSAAICRTYCGLRKHGGANARNRQRLLMGPWMHGVNTRVAGELDFGDSAVLPLSAMRQQWLDRWVKGDRNGCDSEAPVRIFVMGVNAWRDEQQWPPERARDTKCHVISKGSANSLSGDGSLSFDAVHAAEVDRFIYDPEQPVPTLGGSCLRTQAGPTDHQPVERRDDVLVYTSPALEDPLEVTGFVRMILYASSDVIDTDFVARLCDVYPDGRSIILCDGIVRTRFREGLDREVMMTPGTIYELDIDMGVTSNVFLPGHCLRLEITSSCFPRFARNLNTGEPQATGIRMQSATQTVHHSEMYPSHLVLPIVPRGDPGQPGDR